MKKACTGWWLFFGAVVSTWGQSDFVIRWQDDLGNPACELPAAGHTIHVSAWLEGVTQTALQGVDLVVDERGICSWPEVQPGVYTLECLPWSWTLMVDTESREMSPDTVTLIWPLRTPPSARGNQAPLRYEESHPGHRLGMLSNRLALSLDALDLDQLVGWGVVGGSSERQAASKEAMRAALDSSHLWVLDELQAFQPHSMWGDLALSRLSEWRMSLGGDPRSEAMELWAQGRDTRTWTKRLASPGWCALWELRHDQWWDALESQRKPWRNWVATGDQDSLCHAMEWTVDELHMAMWLGLDQKWNRWAAAWWEVRWKDQCEVAEVRRQSEQTSAHLGTAQSWEDMMWMMPSGELDPAWAGEGDWRVWLLTKKGSTSGLREWSVLRQWMEQNALLGMSYGVLSVDGSEEHWRTTLGHRESVKERVRWVGRDPGWWDRLDVERVPQVVVVNPNGDIQTHHAPLPTEGLFAELKRWSLMWPSR